MNVIRHNYITANGNVEVTLGTLRISYKRRVNFIAVEKRLTQVSAKRDKVERAGIKETTETWRAPSEILLHAEPVATALWAVQSERVIPAFVNRPQAGGYSLREIALGASLAAARSTEFCVSRTRNEMIVDHAGRLHQGVADR